MQPTAWDFQNRLLALLNTARHSSQPYVDIESGYLHRQVGEQPKLNDRIPLCCEVMRKMMRPGDLIVNEPPSGADAALTIRYIV
jgi:hypothetical protein